MSDCQQCTLQKRATMRECDQGLTAREAHASSKTNGTVTGSQRRVPGTRCAALGCRVRRNSLHFASS